MINIYHKKLKEIYDHIRSGSNILKPPEFDTVTEWADNRRRLSSESSAEPGPWRTSRTPYLKDIMDAFTDSKVKRIVFVSSSQIGKSEALNCMIGYVIDEDPGSILFIHPTSELAKEYSKLRIAPMIRDCPTISEKISDPKRRDSGNTILQKAFPGGILTMCGSLEAHSLASKPSRYVFGDERDRWATSAGKEGDPWKLAMARQITFYNAKSVEVSTPTIKGASVIESSFNEGTMERWKVQCPHCGVYNDIKFSDIRFDKVEESKQGKQRYAVTDIWYICPACGCISTEDEIKSQHAKWCAENPDAYERGVRSFWLNSFVSPWATWESTIQEYLEAIGNAEKLKVVYNTRFGELWENRGDLESEEGIMARREEYPNDADMPDGPLVITAGVDTQDDRFEYELVGHGHFGETWGLEYGVIMGRPDDPKVWEQLDEVVFDRVLRLPNGKGLTVSMSFVDEGGHFTQNVRQQCSVRISKKVFAIAGSNQHDAPFTTIPKKQKIQVQVQGRAMISACWRYVIGVDAGKQMIMDNLKVQTPGPRYCHFPKRDDYGEAYFHRLLSERLVYKQERKQPWVWEKIPGHDRNEALDTRNYANAAFAALPKDLDKIAQSIKSAEPERVIDNTAKSTTQPASARYKKKSYSIDGPIKNKYIKKIFDDW
jgi:phage terminase large subunit GpA-like protein